MAKLYPPHIEGALPAFCGNTLIIPFEHSRAVTSKYEVNYYCFMLKDIQQSTIVYKDFCTKEAEIQDATGNRELRIEGINNSQLSPGTFYKLQLAYVDNSEQIGYFSDVGIIKYIQKPEVKLTGLSQNGSNNHKYHYQLQYTCNDTTERLYSTQFVISQNSYDNPIAMSDIIIHNTNNDTLTQGLEDYDFLQELSPQENYWIYAMATTTSGYKLLTPYYPLDAQVGIPVSTGRTINPVLDFDNGCISIYTSHATRSTLTGKFKLVRSDEKENFSIWHSLAELEIDASNVTSSDPYLLWRDFTVEQGYNYNYALMIMNNEGNYSEKIKSSSIYADFEDAFLFDGEKQLRIRFDPKVSSFKTTKQEAKTDTLGGRYPIIQRNGYTDYKEFSISGLISHLSDPDGYFNRSMANLKEIDQNSVVTDTSDALDGRNYSTNLNSKNIQLERRFKLEVLDWLNNGKPKLFRSPVEGNYLVRLLNNSLSPIDTLGRMLHSFSTTAYEIDESTPEKLIKHNIIKPQYLEGRNNYNTNRNFISYYLSNLDDRNLLDKQTELKGKEVTGATFSVQNTNEGTYVNINGENVKVSDPNKAIYNDKITSLKQAQGVPFNYSTSDLVTLTYRNVLSNEAYNNLIDSIISASEINQYFGFDYTKMFGDIKIFLQKIYKMICNVRPVIEQMIDLGTEMILQMADWTTEQLKQFIKNHFGGTCVGSFIYKILDLNHKIIGYIDGNKGTWIKEGGQILTTIAQATVTFTRQSGIVPTVYNIVKETVFKDTDFDPTITNIIANPFTCIDIIYKTGVNVFTPVIQNAASIASTISSQNTLCGIVSGISGSGIAQDAISNCENLYKTIVNALDDSGGLPITVSSGGTSSTIENSNTAEAIASGVYSVGSELCDAARGVLNTVVNSGITTPITSITSSVMNLFTGSFNGLFGGMC